ncbi:hypothetical protein MTO96_003921 [Rhipicephalus appendiculatus]
MDRADVYHNIRTLKFDGVLYEVATHVADPIDSCRGRFHLPLDYPEESKSSPPSKDAIQPLPSGPRADWAPPNLSWSSSGDPVSPFTSTTKVARFAASLSD